MVPAQQREHASPPTFLFRAGPHRSEAPACAAEGISSLSPPDSHAHLSPKTSSRAPPKAKLYRLSGPPLVQPR